jgi:hypothetical protein
MIYASETSRREKESAVACSGATILDFPCITAPIRYRFARVVPPFQPLEDYDNVIFVRDESDLSDHEALEIGISE